jgi:hypothetical protein
VRDFIHPANSTEPATGGINADTARYKLLIGTLVRAAQRARCCQAGTAERFRVAEHLNPGSDFHPKWMEI